MVPEFDAMSRVDIVSDVSFYAPEKEAHMTDDSSLTPGGEMNDEALTIEMRSDAAGHLIVWTKAGASGTLGPFTDREIAERAMAAKRIELTVNDKPF